MAGLQEDWLSLHTPPEELLLANTLVTGQSFRWRRTDDSSSCYEMYTGVIGQRLVQMRQLPNDVQYRVLARSSTEDPEADAAVLQDYFNLSTSLAQLAQHWASQDPRYALVAPALPGCRMLRQDPVECLFQFICSSNNHISRIHGMVERLCSTYGSPMLPASGSSGSREGSSQLASQQQQQQQTAGDSRGIKLEPGTPGAAGPGYPSQQAAQQQQQQQELRSLPLPFCQQEPQQLGGHWQQQAAEGPDQGSPSFYAFPTLEQLSAATEEALRADGFGYRAKYIVGSVQQLLDKPEGGSAWLLGLRDRPYAEAHEALCSLPGVGPKVAACVCLFSLDKHDAIPVDTHVWDLATKYYAPHLAKKSLNPKLHAEVQQAFGDRFGPYAGWAHNCLFISELASHKHLLPTGAAAAATETASKKRRKSVELPSTPGNVDAALAAAAAVMMTPSGALEGAYEPGTTDSPDMTDSSPSMPAAAAEIDAGLAVVRRRRRRPAKYVKEASDASEVQVAS